MMGKTEPKYHVNQVLRCLHDWAQENPLLRPVDSVEWDDCWNCYTYSFPLSLIRIEEYELEPVDEPDITPDEWLEQYREEARRYRERKRASVANNTP